ncbi:MAG: fimbrillin family protein [Bacteroidales bacterium]|nr:fimbrillin family protein [Bacteroidales bacterium]
MRKHFILGIMALAALASCTKSEVLNQESQQEKGITFSAYVGKATQTKSTPLASANISDAGIGLLAWRTADAQVTPADDATLTNNAPSFMPNLKLKNEAGAWVYSPTRYWPSTGAYVSFYAYAPYFDVTADYGTNPSDFHPENISIGNIANITSAGGQHKITLTVPSNETGTDYNKHTDFMVARVGNGVANADGTWSGTDANNKTVGINQNLNKDYPDAVKLQMKHALSKISFVGKSGSTTSSYEFTKVIIDDITINGKFASKGTYNLLKEEWSDLTSQPAYKYVNTDGSLADQARYTSLTTENDPFTIMADEFISGKSDPIATGSDWYRLTKSTHDIMVIPFSTTDGTDVIPATIENVTGYYTVVTYSDEACSTVLDVDRVEFNAPINITLEEGKAYQFQLDIELKKITFNVNVEDWQEDDANKYDVVNTNITNKYSVTDESSFNANLPDWYIAAHPWDANTAATLPWLVVELTPTPANKLDVSVTTPAGETIEIPNATINPNNSTKTVTLLTLCAEEIFGQGTSETIGTGKWIVTVNNKSTVITM